MGLLEERRSRRKKEEEEEEEKETFLSLIKEWYFGHFKFKFNVPYLE